MAQFRVNDFSCIDKQVFMPKGLLSHFCFETRYFYPMKLHTISNHNKMLECNFCSLIGNC